MGAMPISACFEARRIQEVLPKQSALFSSGSETNQHESEGPLWSPSLFLGAYLTLRTGNPPVGIGVLVIFRFLQAGYRVVLLCLVQDSILQVV